MMRSVLSTDGATRWATAERTVVIDARFPATGRRRARPSHRGPASPAGVLALLIDSISNPHHVHGDLDRAGLARFDEERMVVASTHVG